MGFGSLPGLGFGHWEMGITDRKTIEHETGIFNLWKNNRLTNGIWANFAPRKWDLYPPPVQDPLKLVCGGRSGLVVYLAWTRIRRLVFLLGS